MIQVEEYNENWPRWFEQLKLEIWPSVQSCAMRIEHVGSTSVVGLAAKPIIDIDIVVENEIKLGHVIESLKKLGYGHLGNMGIAGREAFRSPNHKIKHNLYACLQKSTALKNHLVLRDHLRADSKARDEYSALKRRLASEFGDSIDKYVDGKTNFIISVLSKYKMSENELSSIDKANRAPDLLPVLIVGGGPTGLVLALWLTKIGIKVRIIDKTAKAGTTSRALVVHARTLEYYRQLELDQKVVDKGYWFKAINLWVKAQQRAHIDISNIGIGKTPFPMMLILPQDIHEEFLIEELKKIEVQVERSTELLSLSEKNNYVEVKIKLPSGEIQTESAQFLAGCDGARSVVRHEIGAEFQGSTYPDWFYVADVTGSGPIFNGELHLSLDEAEFIGIFPLKKQGTARFIGVIRFEGDGTKLTWNDVNGRVFKELGAKVEKVNWFSTYHVHHRVAAKFQKGRAFLLGDAGHIHSPLGGQGMNTGIGDAVNLAWKLGEVIKGKSSQKLLESYEIERIAFAQQLVKSTDQAFNFVSSNGGIARFVRTQVIPFIMPKVFKYFRKFFFQTISQTGIHYRYCSLNKGSLGRLAGGDRLPWIESVDNFSALKNLQWQTHIYGSHKLDGAMNFSWTSEMAKKGLAENAAYVIRPDGYIAFF